MSNIFLTVSMCEIKENLSQLFKWSHSCHLHTTCLSVNLPIAKMDKPLEGSVDEKYEDIIWVWLEIQGYSTNEMKCEAAGKLMRLAMMMPGEESTGLCPQLNSKTNCSAAITQKILYLPVRLESGIIFKTTPPWVESLYREMILSSPHSLAPSLIQLLQCVGL